MKAISATIALGILLNTTNAYADSVSKITCTLHERTENVYYDKIDRKSDVVDEDGSMGMFLYTVRFSARVFVEADGTALIQIHDHAKLVVDQVDQIELARGVTIRAQTLPRSETDIRYAVVSCTLH